MMKKLLGIVVLGLLWCFPVHSEIISKDKSVNDYLKDQEYKLHSTGLHNDGTFFYHLQGHKRNTHELITCMYDVGTKVTVCLKP